MKKLLFGTITAVGLSLAIAGGASAANNVNASKFCTAQNDFGVGHGTCTSIVNQCANTGNQTLCICKQLKAADILEPILGVTNMGQCVKVLGGPKSLAP